jgi:hypothetical protein
LKGNKDYIIIRLSLLTLFIFIRIFGLESQKGLVVVTSTSIHLLAGFICTSTDTNKPFQELHFDYIYNPKYKLSPSMKNHTYGNNDNQDSSNNTRTKEEEKYMNINAIYNEQLLLYQSGVYSSYNATIGQLFNSSTGSTSSDCLHNILLLCEERAWIEEMWLEMMESDTFYNKIKFEEVSS